MGKVKIVVVDDDAVARNQIKSYIGNNGKYEVVGEFADGNGAVTWLRNNEPDILICDMQMPRMMGTELMQIVRGIYEYLPILVISAYDDFSYARESIHSGAVDYILKSELDTQKLGFVLDQICEKYHIETSRHKIGKQIGYKYQEDFQEEKIRRMVEEGNIDFSLDYMCCLVISPDYKVVENINVDVYRGDILNAVEDILRQILGNGQQYVVCASGRECLKVLLSFHGIKSFMYVLNLVNNICSKLRRRVARMLDITLTLGIGGIQLKLEDLLEQCRGMEEMVKDKFYLGTNQTFEPERTVKLEKREYHVSMWQMNRLKLNIKNGQMNEVQMQIDEIFGDFARMKCNRSEVIAFAGEVYEAYMESGKLERNVQREEEISGKGTMPGESGKWEESRKLEEDRIEQFLQKVRQMQTLEMIKEFLLHVSRQLGKQGIGMEKMELSALSLRAEEYIKQHYSEDISLESCAAYVDISYTYLSRTFKKEFGVNFVEYLNQIRIQKSQSLLISQKYSIKECAEMVGFRNYNYFFKVFKQIVEMTPNEFIAKYCNKR